MNLITAIIDLITDCVYHPILETIGLGLGSEAFDTIITTVCN